MTELPLDLALVGAVAGESTSSLQCLGMMQLLGDQPVPPELDINIREGNNVLAASEGNRERPNQIKIVGVKQPTDTRHGQITHVQNGTRMLPSVKQKQLVDGGVLELVPQRKGGTVLTQNVAKGLSGIARNGVHNPRNGSHGLVKDAGNPNRHNTGRRGGRLPCEKTINNTEVRLPPEVLGHIGCRKHRPHGADQMIESSLIGQTAATRDIPPERNAKRQRRGLERGGLIRSVLEVLNETSRITTSDAVDPKGSCTQERRTIQNS